MATLSRAVAGGMLRDRVQVLAPSGTITATGGTTTGAATTVIDALWCAIEPLDLGQQLREQLAAGGIQAGVSHQVRCRLSDAEDVTANMTLLELDPPATREARQLEIVIRRADPVSDELHLLCREAV
jgi:head-tail adaptor